MQGPRGLDKLVHDERGVTTISNDGATIMKVPPRHPTPVTLQTTNKEFHTLSPEGLDFSCVYARSSLPRPVP